MGSLLGAVVLAPRHPRTGPRFGPASERRVRPHLPISASQYHARCPFLLDAASILPCSPQGWLSRIALRFQESFDVQRFTPSTLRHILQHAEGA